MEEWLNIYGYPEYQVSSYGMVKSVERKTSFKKGYRIVRERILKQIINNNGYKQVILSRDGKLKHMLVHRLVAEAFLPNPNNLQEVNHKDEDKTNNNVTNLEWCTREYNINYGTRNERSSKKVKCVETNIVYQSITEIKIQLGFAQSHISDCCNGKQKSAYGYHWEWV